MLTIRRNDEQTIGSREGCKIARSLPLYRLYGGIIPVSRNLCRQDRVRPVFVRSSFPKRAFVPLNGSCAVSPESARTRILANSSKVTIVEMGFPGNPKKYVQCSDG